nr:thermonuclease family protein [Sinorhizobium numidicum]
MIGALSCVPAFGDRTIAGRASVIDGDTIEIEGERIRLHGIDAPESSQVCSDRAGQPYRCGQEAALALDTFLKASRPTRCVLLGRDHRRSVGVCFRADGKDVNRWLVEFGHALDWPKYSGGGYSKFQKFAQAAGVGLWGGAFELPCKIRNRNNPSC